MRKAGEIRLASFPSIESAGRLRSSGAFYSKVNHA